MSKSTASPEDLAVLRAAYLALPRDISLTKAAGDGAYALSKFGREDVLARLVTYPMTGRSLCARWVFPTASRAVVTAVLAEAFEPAVRNASGVVTVYSRKAQ